jgi:ACS family hexuronate transporter-like MFS transporter
MIDLESGSESFPSETPTAGSTFKLPGLRWIIIGLVFLATLINYIDRLTISVLAPAIVSDLHLTNTEFGGIATWFLLAYTISQSLSGKLYDRVGLKRGFTVSIIVWSLAAMGHTLAVGLRGLAAARFVLGLGEAGNWPGAAKTVAEWFPPRQRALGMGIFNSGAAIGSIIAPPVIVVLTTYFKDHWQPTFYISFYWQPTFLITGALGFLWLMLWLFIYDKPERHPWLTKSELAVIRDNNERDTTTTGSSDDRRIDWLELLNYRQTWGIVVARFLVDPVWWLFITWLPLFLNQVYGFDLKQIGLFAWVPYVAADAGSLVGGWLSGFLIGRGWSVNSARKIVIAFAALLMPAGIFAAFTSDPMIALALIGIVLFGFQAWINNVQTLPSDFFPAAAVGSVAGLGGTGAGIGSMIFIFATGWVVDHYSYTPILITAGLLPLLGTIALFVLSGRIVLVSGGATEE